MHQAGLVSVTFRPLSPEEIIFTKDGATMTAVVAAMSEVENGVEADMTEVWGGWRLFIADFPPK